MQNEKSTYVMLNVTTHAVMSHVHFVMHACRQPGHPHEYMAHQKLLIDLPFMPAKTIFIKINHLAFEHLKYKNCKPEHAENTSHCHAQ